mmetsp:Transcript_3498/g.9343  ORF Transcript_3498/g.9343 Transcript_3498/m.9343 type:complete len:204 (-) Transcript_3498:559-1170(-)
MLRPVRQSHSRPMESSPAEAAREPSGWKATVYTGRLWPSCSMRHWPVSTSHILHVMSKLAVARCFPMGWKAMRARRSSWPTKIRSSFPVPEKSRAVLSTDAVARARVLMPPSPCTPCSPLMLLTTSWGSICALGCHTTSVQRSSFARATQHRLWRLSATSHTDSAPPQPHVASMEPLGENSHPEMGRSSPISLLCWVMCFAWA